jgi:hypothetical protein
VARQGTAQGECDQAHDLARIPLLFDTPCFAPCCQTIHLFLYEKGKLIMGDSLLGDVEIPLTHLTEEDFLDQWMPLRSGNNRSTW